MTDDLFPEARVDPTEDLDRRYTTRKTLDLCQRLAGVTGWDLDVAADEESYVSPRFYDVQRDGLKCSWLPGIPPATMRDGSLPRGGRGKRWSVWCNPPYSDIEPWVERAWDFAREVDCRFDWTVSMLLPCNRTEQPWWQNLVEPYRDRGCLDGTQRGGGPIVQWGALSLSTHFLPGRVKFGHPGNRDAVGVGSPPFGCVLLVWRRA